MDNLSQDNFDDLFRESSERVDFEYREDAWTALDGMLEEKEKKRKWLWILLGISLSTLLLGGLFYFSKNTPVQVSTNEVAEQVSELSSPSLSNEEDTNSVIHNSDNAGDKKVDNINSTPILVDAKYLAVKQNTLSNNSNKTTQNQTPVRSKDEVFATKENVAQYHTTTKENKQIFTSSDSVPVKIIRAIEIPQIATLLPLLTLPNETIKFDITYSPLARIIKENPFSFGVFGSLDYSSLSGTRKINSRLSPWGTH